jgi:peptidoglycan hydrolase CwlO-like protein
MSDISREEIDAKLEANEARRDAQIASINGKIDTIINRLDSQSQRMDRLERSIDATTGMLSSLKTTIILTGISSSIAIIFGVAGFNAALLSNMASMYESGKNNAEMQQETRRQVEQTAALLKQMQEKYGKQAAHD